MVSLDSNNTKRTNNFLFGPVLSSSPKLKVIIKSWNKILSVCKIYIFYLQTLITVAFDLIEHCLEAPHQEVDKLNLNNLIFKTPTPPQLKLTHSNLA